MSRLDVDVRTICHPHSFSIVISPNVATISHQNNDVIDDNDDNDDNDDDDADDDDDDVSCDDESWRR